MRLRRFLVLFIVLGALTTAACRPPASVVTDPGRRGYYAAQVLQRVAEVQNIAIQLSATTPPALSVEHARIIVQWSVVAAKVLKQADEGWAKVVLASWMEVKAQLPPSVFQNVQIVTLFAVLDSLLQTFAGGTP